MEPDRDELIARLEAVKPRLEEILRSHGAHEPDWDPLEKVMPYEWCGGFMFMGYSGLIRMYKHGITRRYLYLDPGGNAYSYIENRKGFVAHNLHSAIEEAFEGLEEQGYDRTTPYDDEVRAERAEKLASAGWTTIRVDPEGN